MKKHWVWGAGLVLALAGSVALGPSAALAAPLTPGELVGLGPSAAVGCVICAGTGAAILLSPGFNVHSILWIRGSLGVAAACVGMCAAALGG